MENLIITIAAAWVISGFINFGFTFAYFQRGWPDIAKENYKDDLYFCIIDSLCGPISLIATCIKKEYKHGFKLW